jgi:selenocysteine lyase/cysteine desulfurase/glycine/D-amino acid oxidase-like deaminating enzyme
MNEGSPVSGVDVAEERRRTPGTRYGHHLNAAGSSLPTVETLDAVIGHLRLESRVGGYEAAAMRGDALSAVYTDVAGLIGAAATEIALVDSATTAMQRVITGMSLQSGDRVIVTPSAYVSVALHLLALQRANGISIEVAPLGEDGAIDLDALGGLVTRDRVRLLIGTHVPTSSGLVEPVRQMGELARAANVPFVVDATQSVGQLPVDVGELRCSALVTTGRKFLRAPRGTGILWIADGFANRLAVVAPDVRGARWTGDHSWTFADGARRLETWEASHALRLGLGVAAQQLAAVGIDAVRAHTGALSALLRARLAAVPGVMVTEPPGAGSAIVTFVVAGRSAEEIRDRLAERRIRVTNVPASHAQWDLGPRRLAAVVRASVHVYNNAEDIEALGVGLTDITAGARRSAVARPVSGPSVGPDTADVVVVGMGIHGASTVVALAARGLRVVAVEQFAEGHDRGSSHGETRMIRRAYPSPIWSDLVESAYAAWDSLGVRIGETLIEPRGGLFVRAPGRATPLDGPGCRTIAANGLADTGFPARVTPGATAVYDPSAGVLRADVALRQLWRLARAGADIRTGVRALHWAHRGQGVELHTTQGRIRAGHLVLCPGPWVGGLLPELDRAVRVQRILNLHVRPAGDATLPDGLPVFSVDSAEGLVYGIPPGPGRLLKIGLDEGPQCDPDGRRPETTAAEVAALVRAAGDLWGVPLEAAARTLCLYSVTADRRFLVGGLPGHPGVTVLSACSGHGFKFGPVLGEAAADFATGVPRPDLDFLDPARILTRPGTAVSR